MPEATLPWRWSDKRKSGVAAFRKAKNVQERYATQLRKVARVIGHIVNMYPAGEKESAEKVNRALHHYAEVITPWAESTVKVMIAEVNQQDYAAWRKHAQEMERDLAKEIDSAPTGKLMHDFLHEQVNLIRSLPLKAAQRVHELTIEGMKDSSRAAEIAKMIKASGKVTATRATLIARTEIARTSTALVRARAQHVHSDGYIWRTARDRFVRPSHRKMEGQFVPWHAKPHLDGMTGHAGEFPNCRCYPEPVIPDII